jgi:hypothetical protein
MGMQRLNDRGKGDIHNTRIQSGHEGTNGNTECDPPPPIHCEHGHKPKFKQIFDIYTRSRSIADCGLLIAD